MGQCLCGASFSHCICVSFPCRHLSCSSTCQVRTVSCPPWLWLSCMIHVCNKLLHTSLGVLLQSYLTCLVDYLDFKAGHTWHAQWPQWVSIKRPCSHRVRKHSFVDKQIAVSREQNGAKLHDLHVKKHMLICLPLGCCDVQGWPQLWLQHLKIGRHCWCSCTDSSTCWIPWLPSIVPRRSVDA